MASAEDVSYLRSVGTRKVWRRMEVTEKEAAGEEKVCRRESLRCRDQGSLAPRTDCTHYPGPCLSSSTMMGLAPVPPLQSPPKLRRIIVADRGPMARGTGPLLRLTSRVVRAQSRVAESRTAP